MIGETQKGQSRMKESDIAWLAGILDGEGTFGTTTGGNGAKCCTPKMQIGNTSLLLIEKACNIIREVSGGYEAYRSARQTQCKSGSIIHTMEISRREVLDQMLQLLLPHLTAKKAQAEEIIAFIASRNKKPSRNSRYDEYERGLLDRIKKHRRAAIHYVIPHRETARETLSNPN